jgi:hypothetical protein
MPCLCACALKGVGVSGLIRFGQLGLVLLALWLSACAGLSPPLEGTGQGAAEGAVSGVSLRAAAESDAATRVNLLAAVGAGDGNNWTRRMQGKLHAMQQATEGTGLQVERTVDDQLKMCAPAWRTAASRPNGSRLVGHTDSSGTDANNDPLSLRRAETMRGYLEVRGIKADRIELAGRGSREPIAGNDTPEDRSRNRRVEILLREPRTYHRN